MEELGFRKPKYISSILSFIYRLLLVLIQELKITWATKQPLLKSENQRLHEMIYLFYLRDKDSFFTEHVSTMEPIWFNIFYDNCFFFFNVDFKFKREKFSLYRP